MLNLFYVGIFDSEFIPSLMVIVDSESVNEVDLFLAVIEWSICSRSLAFGRGPRVPRSFSHLGVDVRFPRVGYIRVGQ